MIQELLRSVTRLLDQKGIGYMISCSLALNDIEMLLSLPGIDIDYVVLWCKNLKLNTFKLLGN